MLYQSFALVFSGMCLLAACSQKPPHTSNPDSLPPKLETVQGSEKTETVNSSTEESSTEEQVNQVDSLTFKQDVGEDQQSISNKTEDSDSLSISDDQSVAGQRTPINNSGEISSGNTDPKQPKEPKSGKEMGQPPVDLSTLPGWVSEIVRTKAARTLIKRSSKDGKSYFKVDRCVGCSDNMQTIFDENQKTICQIGGITGRDTCNEQGISFGEWEVIYQSERNAKIEKPSGPIFQNK